MVPKPQVSFGGESKEERKTTLKIETNDSEGLENILDKLEMDKELFSNAVKG